MHVLYPWGHHHFEVNGEFTATLSTTLSRYRILMESLTATSLWLFWIPFPELPAPGAEIWPRKWPREWGARELVPKTALVWAAAFGARIKFN